MSLKSKLKALIQAGSGQAMPSDQGIELDPNIESYVAPCDGYLTGFVNTSDSGAQSGYVGFVQNGWGAGDFIVHSEYGYSTSRLAVAKGKTVNIYKGRNGMFTALSFIKSLSGGGDSPLEIRRVGGGLWQRLSHSCANLLAKRALSVSQAELTIESISHLPKRRRNTSRLKTDGLLSKQRARASKLNYLDQSSSRCQTTITVPGDDVICQFAKATVSTSTFGDFLEQHRIKRISCQREDSSNLFFWEVAA